MKNTILYLLSINITNIMESHKLNMTPLQLMQKLYDGYNRKNTTTTFQNQEFVKNRKANHTVKLTKFLN